MLDGKLLDNNVISTLLNERDAQNANAQARLRASSPSPIFLPVIAVAEIECGMAKANNPDAHAQKVAIREFFARYPILPFDHQVVAPYALLRAKLWNLLATPKGRTTKEKLPEELCDSTTGKELGIDERDLQIVSIALAFNLIFATFDRNIGMRRIEEAARLLVDEGKWPSPLRVEDWTSPLSAPATHSPLPTS